jgi:hypothetical protein
MLPSLRAHMRGLLAPFAAPVLVYDQHAFAVRCGAGVPGQQFEAALVGLSGLPAGLREEPLQALRLLALRPLHGLGVRKRGQGLAALGRKQQPFEITTEAFALGADAEQIVEPLGEILERTGGRSGGRSGGKSFGHGGISSLLPPLEHSHLPTSTNYR